MIVEKLTMRKYYQLILTVVCLISVVLLLIYRHEYYRLRYVLEVLNFFGKPGLSEIEFCGAGFNATLLSEIVRNHSMELKETPPLFQQINENFYSYSSFLRTYQKYENLEPSDLHKIDTIVIGKAHLEPNFRCNIWLENTVKPKSGRFTFEIVSDSDIEYHLYIFHCSLKKDFGKPVGVSYYVNDYNINPIHAAVNKVISVNTKRKPKEINNIRFVNNILPAVCVIPNQVPVVTRDSFIEFLVFHHIMGVNLFTVYDSTISEEIIRRLNMLPEDITNWRINFFPLNYPFIFGKSYHIVRAAVEYDCLFRHFRADKEDSDRASHVAVLSWDEYLVPRVHNNLKRVISDIDSTRKVRSLEIKVLLFCLNQEDDYNVETDYPEIMRKTHYYTFDQETKHLLIRNLDSMKSFDDVFELQSSNKVLSTEILGVHKYTECRDPKRHHPNGVGYNETQMQMFQHKFEGAMLKFAENLMNDKIFKLYKSGQIWEKTSSSIREML